MGKKSQEALTLQFDKRLRLEFHGARDASDVGLTALVLAGGRGERLRPHTQDRPKPMVLINGQPLLFHHLAWLQRGGVGSAYILCGYKHEAIRDHFGDGEVLGIQLHYVVEEQPLGRGGALKRGLSALPPGVDTVVATNGDVITDQSLAELVSAHRRHRGLATIMLCPLVSPYGIVTAAEDGRVLDFLEKPTLPYWVNGGVYVLSRQIMEYLPDVGDHEVTAFPTLAGEGKLFCFKSAARWLTVDTVKDLNEASRLLASHR